MSFRAVSRQARLKRQRQRQRLLMMVVGLFLVSVPLLGSALLPDTHNDWVKTPDQFYRPEWLSETPVDPAQALKPLPLEAEDTALRQKVEGLLAEYPAQFKPHLFYMNLQTGRWLSINGTDAVPAASVIKLPVLLQYFRQLDAGNITPNTHLMYEDFEQAGGSGTLQYQPPGRPLLAQDVATRMIQSSDNTCTNMLLYTMGGVETLNPVFSGLGLQHTRVNNWLPDLSGTNMVSMQDTATVLYNVYEGHGLSPTSRDAALAILKGTHNRRLLPGLLPANTVIAHKTGDIGTSLGDSGLFLMPNGNHFILTMQVERPYNHYSGKDMIQRVGKLIYDDQLSTPTVAAASL